ncbi:UDP-N-acetylmuramate dehydrogenase [Candidatus Microgenomates bacterium]|nr:MAG: UDP-N-acetylmuramate dehydrogenase [Candidatus Microgenomates bacterium]
MIVKKNVSISQFTNFGTGGIVDYFITLNSKPDLKKATLFTKEKGLKYYLLGSGTNVLFSDNKMPIAIFKLSNHSIILSKNTISAGAGVIWDDLVKFSVTNKLQGIECMSGIPGTVGAAPIQNIGAYGQEVSEVLDSVEVYDTVENKFVTFTNKNCELKYRDSLFKRTNRYIVYSAKFKLNTKFKIDIKYDSLKEKLRGKEITLKSVREEILKIRKEKFGDLTGKGTAGSFFKNPVVSARKFSSLLKLYPDMPHFKDGSKYKLFGAWLIEQTGWKGYKGNNVSVSDKNPLVLKNFTGHATSQEIYDLSEKIIKSVSDKFDIALEREVNLVGF